MTSDQDSLQIQAKVQPKLRTLITGCLTFTFALTACVGNGDSSSGNDPIQSAPIAPPTVVSSNELIKINQVGYLPSMAKLAIVPQTQATSFQLLDAGTGVSVLSGDLSSQGFWAPAGENVKIADFSSFNTPGEYHIKVEGFTHSNVVTINTQSYDDLHDGVLKAYYFNRASQALNPSYASDWARPLGHPDTNVQVHESAQTPNRPAGTLIESPKGWYDAGDYNKYIVNSGISTYTLLAAYSDFSNLYQNRDINIPESGDAIPDILDEVMWNLDWMQTMQDPDDGGVYHKLTTLKFEAAVMPHNATSQRYVVHKNSGAALNFASVMAKASRVYTPFSQFSSKVSEYQTAAIRAFQFAQANPTLYYVQPSDVSTGVYGDNDLAGEFAWASAELYLLTQDDAYLALFKQYARTPSSPSWSDTMALAYMSLLSEGQGIMPPDDYADVSNSMLNLADSIVVSHNNSAYRVAMENNDFVWGSNSSALNKAMMLLQAHRVSNTANSTEYLEAATGLLDYVLGKNPTDYSFVTGFGVKTPMDIHHRQSYSDGLVAPVPGFVAGGPQPGRQDGCSYIGTLPATTYIDDWCSYASNEVTINWNAPMVYVLAGLYTYQ
jgi:endoglucanase